MIKKCKCCGRSLEPDNPNFKGNCFVGVYRGEDSKEEVVSEEGFCGICSNKLERQIWLCIYREMEMLRREISEL